MSDRKMYYGVQKEILRFGIGSFNANTRVSSLVTREWMRLYPQAAAHLKNHIEMAGTLAKTLHLCQIEEVCSEVLIDRIERAILNKDHKWNQPIS